MAGRSVSTASRIIISCKAAGFYFAAKILIARLRSTVHGLRFLLGFRVADGELACEPFESFAAVAVGLELGMGNANAGVVNADDVPDAVGIGEGVPLEEGEGLASG